MPKPEDDDRQADLVPRIDLGMTVAEVVGLVALAAGLALVAALLIAVAATIL